MSRPSDLVAVATFHTEHDADLAVSLLRSCGLDAVRSSDDCGGTDPALGFATRSRVHVLRAVEEEALEILRELDSATSAVLDEDVPELREGEGE